tara:strand:+ start:518 stop:1237 length:720 start_codon:yes stop_codon:yes gene_type:complete
MDYEQCLEVAKEAALKAGNFLLSQKDTDMVVEDDDDRDIKLELDRLTEVLIRDSLKKTDIEVFGEEIESTINSELFWVVDPIDGTANYFRGLDQCCISIALMKGKDCLLGVIYNFNTDEMYYAQDGKGAFLNNKKIFVSAVKKINKASLSTGFPASESMESSLDFLRGLKQWKKIRMFGSAALSCAYIASGKCDAYMEKGVYLWDFAAGICLVKEAGGIVEYDELDKNRYVVKMTNGFL